MKRNENKEKLILQLKQTKNICNDMSEVVDNFENLTYEEINDRCLKMVALYEKGCLKMRKFPSYLGNPNAMKEVQEIIDEVMNIEVGYTEQGWFCVRMPFLLPKKESGSSEYVKNMLYSALNGPVILVVKHCIFLLSILSLQKLGNKIGSDANAVHITFLNQGKLF